MVQGVPDGGPDQALGFLREVEDLIINAWNLEKSLALSFKDDLTVAHNRRCLEVELPTSKQVIASLLNLTPETLSRIFHELSSAGLIVVQGKHVLVPDVARLARYQA